MTIPHNSGDLRVFPGHAVVMAFSKPIKRPRLSHHVENDSGSYHHFVPFVPDNYNEVYVHEGACCESDLILRQHLSVWPRSLMSFGNPQLLGYLWAVQISHWILIVLGMMKLSKGILCLMEWPKVKAKSKVSVHVIRYWCLLLTVDILHQKRPHVVWKELHCSAYLNKLLWMAG